MHPTTLHPPPFSFPITTSSNFTFYDICVQPKKPNQRKKHLSISLNSIQISYEKKVFERQNFSPLHPLNVSHKLKCLVSEFKSLPQPIDRVKRLLQYASLIPLFDESAKVDINRVNGCTAQVWLEVRVDDDGKMRFRVDSDSEITKGFCSCLIWLLDGAAPEEVLKVKVEDLVEMNVGLPANSRVNTWNNVLVSMHKRTKELVEDRCGGPF